MSAITLPNKIELYVGRKIDFSKEVLLQDDGEGAYIKEWNVENFDKPTDEQLKEFEIEAQNKLNLSEIHAKRRLEYPPITDYIDGVVKNDQAQIDKYIADCLAVKAKYPKGVA